MCVLCGAVLAETPTSPASGVGFVATDETNLMASFPLSSAVERALRDNAELRSLRARADAMQERPAQARALPNPMFAYSGMNSVDGARGPSTNEKYFMVQQEFPWFGKRDLREGVARKDAAAMSIEAESMAQDIAMQVKETYFDLQAVQRAIGIARGESDVLQRIEKIAESAYTTGARTQQDVLKAKSETILLWQRLLELASQENTLKARLNLLLGRAPDAPLGAPSTPPCTHFTAQAETVSGLATANRPEIRAAETRVARYELERQLMAKESLPDYKLGLEYRRIGNADDMLMFTVSIDLPIRASRIAAGAREAEKMKVAAEAAREAATQKSRFEVQDAWFKWQTARRTLDLYRKELIPQAEARFKASEAGYQTGKVDFMDLLESQRFLLNARVMAVMAEGALGMQFARLERAAGVALTPTTDAK